MRMQQRMRADSRRTQVVVPEHHAHGAQTRRRHVLTQRVCHVIAERALNQSHQQLRVGHDRLALDVSQQRICLRVRDGDFLKGKCGDGVRRRGGAV